MATAGERRRATHVEILPDIHRQRDAARAATPVQGPDNRTPGAKAMKKGFSNPGLP